MGSFDSRMLKAQAREITGLARHPSHLALSAAGVLKPQQRRRGIAGQLQQKTAALGLASYLLETFGSRF